MSVQAVRGAIKALRYNCRLLATFAHTGFEGERPLTIAYTVDHWFFYQERLIGQIMAAAKTTKKNVNDKKEFKGFVNYVLTVDDKASFKKWEIDDTDVFLLVAGDVSEGYKMGVSYNAQNSTFVATYMCNSDDNPNAGYMLSSFAPDWFNAVKSLVFKHHVILENLWPTGKAAERDSWG